MEGRKWGCKLGCCQSSTAFLIPKASWLPPGSLVLAGTFSIFLLQLCWSNLAQQMTGWLGRSCCNILSAKDWVLSRENRWCEQQKACFRFTELALTKTGLWQMVPWVTFCVEYTTKKKKSSTNPQQTSISWDYLTLKAWSQFCRQIWQTCQLKTAILWLCKGMKAGSELLHQALLFKIIYSFVWVQLTFWTGDTWCNSNGAHVVRWEPISDLFIDVEWLNSQWSQLFQCTHAISDSNPTVKHPACIMYISSCFKKNTRGTKSVFVYIFRVCKNMKVFFFYSLSLIVLAPAQIQLYYTTTDKSMNACAETLKVANRCCPSEQLETCFPVVMTVGQVVWLWWNERKFQI